MLSEKKWEPMQVLMLGALVFLSLAGGVLLAEIASQLLKSRLDLNGTLLLRLVASVIGFHGMALVWVHFFLRKHQITWGAAFGLTRERAVPSLVTALAVLPAVLAGVILLSLGSEWTLRQLHEYLGWSWLQPEAQTAVQLLQEQWHPGLIALQGIVAVVLAPVAEEVLFRGVLYTAIKQRGHPAIALWITSVLFGAIHFYPVGFLSLILLAVVLVAVYERTQSLLAPILVHALFNGLNFYLIVAKPGWAEKLFTP